jgi:hypothetical protein
MIKSGGTTHSQMNLFQILISTLFVKIMRMFNQFRMKTIFYEIQIIQIQKRLINFKSLNQIFLLQ